MPFRMSAGLFVFGMMRISLSVGGTEIGPNNSITQVVEQLTRLEDEIRKRAAAAKSFFGECFEGTPDDWSRAEAICAWIERIGSEPALIGSVPALVAACISSQDAAAHMIADATAANNALVQLRMLLAASRVRPDPEIPIATFVAMARANLTEIESGVRALRGRPNATVTDMRRGGGIVGGKPLRSVWTIPVSRGGCGHFATFPEEIVRRAILLTSNPGDAVLDPFAGTGTTGEVALRLGRSAILIELNRSYILPFIERHRQRGPSERGGGECA